MRKCLGLFKALNRRGLLVLGIVLGVAVFGFIAWQTNASAGWNGDASDKASPRADDNPVVSQIGKVTTYKNGVSKIEPEAFGVTAPVRDLPTSVEDAAAKSAAYVTNQMRDEMRKQEMRAKGISEAEIERDDLNRQNAKRIKKVLPGAGAGDGPFEDPLVNRGRDPNAPQVMPTPGLTFDGATQADNAAQGVGAVLPPDVNGDVGLNHYVSSVNLVYKIFNKNGTVAAGPFKTSALFGGLPAADPCRVNNNGDPVVVYDSLADRWHISQFALPSNPNNYQCVAVSVTGDPTGAYYVWSYVYPGAIFNDYPKVGVWPDAYHMTFNQFNNAGTAFLGAGILSQDRPKALVGDPTAAAVYVNIQPIDPNAGGLLPADIDGILAPPVGMAEVMAEYRADEFGDPIDGIRYYRWVPNFTTPASSVLTVLPDVALAAFDARQPSGRGDIEQMGGANLDSLSDRLMHLFKYRNIGTQAAPVNSFVGSFPVNVSGVSPTTAGTYQTGVRWFEMRRSGDVFSVFDQGTHNLTPGNGASGLNNWMSSIAQDNRGDIAIGFSQSSTAQNTDIKVAGRTVNTMNSGTLNEGEALFFDALGSQTSTSNRWGDYSAMNVDPVDDCTFWYTQEYYAATGSTTWSTRVGSFRFPQCTNAPKGTISGTITTCASGAPVNLATVNATGGLNRITGAAGTYSMTVAPGTYTVSSNKGIGLTGTTTPTVVVANGQNLTANICLAGTAVLAPTTATLVSESCLPANGVIDPGETVTVAFGVQNTGGANTVNDVGTLQNTGGVTGAGGPQNYGVVVAGGSAVSRNFTFTADAVLACGANFIATIQHQDGATNLGSFTYTLPTGLNGAPTTTSYTGPPVPVPDSVPAGVNVILPVSGIVGNISDVNFRLDALAGCDTVLGNTNASMDHTFNGDLQFKLTSPGGTTVNLITNRGSGGDNFCTVLLDDDGGFPAASTIPTTGAVTGNFAPESPLSAFDGQNANGNWTLNVADTAGIDTGSLRRYSLIISGRTCCNSPAGGSVSGTITYGNAIGSPAPPRFVRSVSVASTAGSPAVGPVITGTPGTYVLTGFGAGSYTIKPTKPGGANGSITSNDAARVAQGVVGAPSFVSQNQRFTADTSGNGGVTSNDAALIARFAAGLTSTGNTGQWKFFVTGAPSPLPTVPQTYNDSRTYPSISGSQTGQDYIALLVGEATGNYNPGTNPRPAGSGPERSIDVKIPQMLSGADKEIVIPVTVNGAADKEIISYEFDLRYDPSVIQPLANPVEVSGTVSRGLLVVTNPHEPGLLRVVVYGPMPIVENGVLLNLRFTSVGAVGLISPLVFERIMFNEGDPRVIASDGKVEISMR